jgi:hypothetical protein
LPTPATNVRIGNKLVQVISSTREELVIKSPVLAPGIYDLIIPIDEALGNVR